MTPWTERSSEERALLNPSFCALLLWHAANGHMAKDGVPLAFEETFLVLPLVLHRGTRESLPRTARTSLAVWLIDNPLARSRVAGRARLLVPFTKESLLFGGVHGLFRFQDGSLAPGSGWKPSFTRTVADSSDEVRECLKRAEFVGGWFAQAGSASSVLALLGVRP